MNGSHFHLTRLLDGDLNDHFPEGVMDVEESKLEEELVDKPRTTICTKFSVLLCIRIPFLMECGF